MPGNFGTSPTADGCDAFTVSSANSGIYAHNDATNAAPANSVGGNGVFGLSTVPNASGVFGANNNGGVGVAGNSDNGTGMVATTKSNATQGIYAANNGTAPAPAGSAGGNGVFGWSTVPNASGVFGGNDNAGSNGVAGISKNGTGIYAQGGQFAGYFVGNVQVTGDISLSGADCAEHFDITALEKVEPGTVMVINEDGLLEPSQQAYDKKVAGVISGAGKFKRGIILDRQESDSARAPIALIGKVYCKVDSEYSAIEVGDLLTTSPTPGYAMKAADPSKAFGSVIGKALRRLGAGRGLIPILIALQ
jgi:hypothetical protein